MRCSLSTCGAKRWAGLAAARPGPLFFGVTVLALVSGPKPPFGLFFLSRWGLYAAGAALFYRLIEKPSMDFGRPRRAPAKPRSPSA